jgi:rare lipoprotein A
VVGVANRTLPCGTLVKVTYAGHSLTVPVLDRGPYADGASWDLTSGAAEALGITETVRIATHVVGRVANTPTLGLPASSATAGASGTSSGGALAG